MKIAKRLFRFLKPRTSGGRVVLWAALATLVLGAIDFCMPLEEYLRSQRNQMHRHAASGDIVLVAIDDRSLRDFGRFPWSGRQLADLVGKLDQKGAKRIFVNMLLADRSNPVDDGAFRDALKSARGKVVLAVAIDRGPATGGSVNVQPLPEFIEHAALAHVGVQYTVFHTVKFIPPDMVSQGKTFPSFATLLGNAGPNFRESLQIDYSIDPNSIPVVSAADVLSGKASSALKGKDVVIGTTFHPYTDGLLVLGHGVLPDTYAHVLGAETLRSGDQTVLSWIWPFLAALIMCIGLLLARHRMLTIIAIPAGIVGAVFGPLPFEANFIFTDSMPVVVLLLIVGAGLSWCWFRERYRERGLTNDISGLPNLAALNQSGGTAERALVAARVHNYAAICATLNAEDEKALVEQMAKRLMVGSSDSCLYHGDEGIFAWFVERGHDASAGSHLDALCNMFRSPILVADKQFDLDITFGLDIACDRLVANRLPAALVAADEAHKEGLKWKEHDPSRLEASSWKLSLLSQLDAAIDSGDVWIAYQPKLDLTTNEIVGAEALARWTHGEKGAISPVEFILAAEQSNRIEKLTHYILEHAIRAASLLNGHGRPFSVSVNISARLLDDPNLVSTIRKLLTKHRLDAEHLTLEVTETAAIGNAARSLATLRQLRDMGVVLSVDDYGTGMSTLDYLQRIPASEIKIDQTFVMGMQANHATKVMVNSTIQLAHSLGQKVVAEGVEDQETMDELRRMGCDLAQGYHIGRPVTFRALSKSLMTGRKEHAA